MPTRTAPFVTLQPVSGRDSSTDALTRHCRNLEENSYGDRI